MLLNAVYFGCPQLIGCSIELMAIEFAIRAQQAVEDKRDRSSVWMKALMMNWKGKWI
jgi:hypothetical protein